MIPALAVAGWMTGASPARWLLPCLAFTAGALALGELIGLAVGGRRPRDRVDRRRDHAERADRPGPVVLEPASLPYWAGLIGVIAVALALRRDAYKELRSDTWFVR